MNVSLTPELEDLVQEKVQSGLYASASEVVQEALRLMKERDRLHAIRASLALAEQQIERGEFEEWTPELMRRLSEEADEMARQGLQPHPDVCP